MNSWVMTGMLAVPAFLLGSIPFGVLIARRKGVDIRSVGSGNTGATNVYRGAGWQSGLIVLLLDLLKGFAPTMIAHRLLSLPIEHAFLLGTAAALGHCFSPFLGFRGGKGIATILGASLAATPQIAGASVAVFVIGFVLTRIVSASSILAGLSAIIFAILLQSSTVIVGIYVGLFILILVRHRDNIRRLLGGDEPKL